MELDDLKQVVANLRCDVAEVRRLSVVALKGRTLDRTRASLRPVLWEHAGQVALGVALLLMVGPIWWQQVRQPPLLLAGLVLNAYAVLMIVLGVRVIAAVRTLDLDAPVVDIQRDLARLRRSYVMTGFVVGLPWWLLWIPLVMVVFGVDLATFGSPSWLVVNFAIGVVGMAGTLWWFRHLWLEPVGSERRRGVEDSFAGDSFRAARSYLDEIARFERE